MANTAPTIYEIRTVHDFLKVPEPRRAVCIREFAHWCAVMSAIGVANSIFRDAFGVESDVVTVESGGDCYRWIDDDKGIAQVHFRTPDGSASASLTLNTN